MLARAMTRRLTDGSEVTLLRLEQDYQFIELDTETMADTLKLKEIIENAVMKYTI
jgi:hypothetical protein